MTIAVNDACIFIDILDLEILGEFFDLDLEVHTTIDVWNELHFEQQQVLAPYRSVHKLTIHILESEDLDVLKTLAFPRTLSDPDKSVIYITQKLGAKLLSSDLLVRQLASSHAIDKHGMFWVLDEMVDQGKLSKSSAYQKIDLLTRANLMYLNNAELMKEMKKRLRDWSSD